MQRYFLEVAYKGTHYSGFQIQENANSIQAEIEKAIPLLLRQSIQLTGSSRTDSGVHAIQNFFHFDFLGKIHPQFVYKLNAILPKDIVIKGLYEVTSDAHCRFDAIGRDYTYYIYQQKDPFLQDRSFFYPYAMNIERLNQAAEILKEHNDFTSFSKRKTQVKSFNCVLLQSHWLVTDKGLQYNVSGNRFLRGMVRGLTATMLKVGRGKITVQDFVEIIAAKDCKKASFAVPAHGLFLNKVKYPYLLNRINSEKDPQADD